MGGELVRLDLPDPTLLGYGVVARDHSSAIFTIASVGRSDVTLPGRLRFPGLDPHRRYRLRPIPVGHPPSGLNPPPWWGGTSTEFEPSGERPTQDWGVPPEGGTDLILPGAALASTGVMAADMHAAQAILYRAEALD